MPIKRHPPGPELKVCGYCEGFGREPGTKGQVYCQACQGRGKMAVQKHEKGSRHGRTKEQGYR